MNMLAGCRILKNSLGSVVEKEDIKEKHIESFMEPLKVADHKIRHIDTQKDHGQQRRPENIVLIIMALSRPQRSKIMITTRDIKVDLSRERKPLSQKTTKEIDIYVKRGTPKPSKIVVSTHDIEDVADIAEKKRRDDIMAQKKRKDKKTTKGKKK